MTDKKYEVCDSIVVTNCDLGYSILRLHQLTENKCRKIKVHAFPTILYVKISFRPPEEHLYKISPCASIVERMEAKLHKCKKKGLRATLSVVSLSEYKSRSDEM